MTLQPQPVFMFANQAGLDMLETTLVALQDITLEKIFDESGRKALCPDFAKLMQQVNTEETLLFICFVYWGLILKKKKKKWLYENLCGFSSFIALVAGICLFTIWNLCVDNGETCFVRASCFMESVC